MTLNEDSEEEPLSPLADVKKMNEIVSGIIALIVLINVAKKTGVFGQMTLTGSKALDWLKDGQSIEIDMIEMGPPSAFVDEWNLPDWLNSDWMAIIFPVNDWENPVLVSQMSVLKWIENQCVDWEGTIGKAKGIKRNKKPVAQIHFTKENPHVEFSRRNKTKFAPYDCKIKSKKSKEKV